MKSLKIRSWLLGAFMFVFGTLKLVNPIRGWFHVQLITSGIGDFAFPFGVGAEIITGLLLIGALVLNGKLSPGRFFTAIIIGSVLVVFTMITATYVHLQPRVPANVLPLGIKPPIIPLSVMVLAIANILYTAKRYKTALNAMK